MLQRHCDSSPPERLHHMMTAQKQSTADREGPPTEPGTPALGFAKLVNSVEGLQQRLGDFSIEELTRAEDTANTLIRRLALVRNRLDRIAELKNSFADVHSAVGRLTAADLDLIGAASMETAPSPQAIIDARKIIRLRRFLLAVPSGAEQETFEASLDPLPTTAPAAPGFDPDPEPEYGAVVSAPTPSVRESETPALPYDADTWSDSGAIPLPAPRENEHLQPDHTREERFSTADNDDHSQAPSSGAPESAQNEAEPVSSLPWIAEVLPESAAASDAGESFAFATPAPTESIMAFQPAPEADHPPLPEIDMREQEANAALLLSAPQSPEHPAGSNTTPEFASDVVSPAAETAFDRRLLDELIQSYGELIPYTGTAARPDPAPSADTDGYRVRALPPPADSGFSEATDDSKAHAEPSLPPEPNFVMAEPASAVESTAVSRAERRMPSMRAGADLDRQLKKIIEDYGQYDLYSQPTSRNFKKSGIVAFIILGLVLFGVYFFKSPAQSVPIQPGATLQSAPSGERPANEAIRKTDPSN
jgi:hypothetical protein